MSSIHPRFAPILSLSFLFLASSCAARDQPVSQPVSCPVPSAAADRARPAEVEPVATSRTGVFVDRDITTACGIDQPKSYFEFDSANLRSTELAGLGFVANCLSNGALKGRRVVITGRTDPRGSEAHNMQLGMSRASSVGGFFAAKGVTSEQIVTRSTGEARATGTEPSEWAYDRRVDIRLAK